MNSELKVIRRILNADEVTLIELGQPVYEIIVKNMTDDSIYIYCGEKENDFDINKSVKLNSNMGQLVFMNNNYKREFSFDKVYIKSVSGGEVEIQIIGF